LNSIQDCPDTGCGNVDPNLNKQKNIRTDSGTPTDKDFQDLATLADPVTGSPIHWSPEYTTVEADPLQNQSHNST